MQKTHFYEYHVASEVMYVKIYVFCRIQPNVGHPTTILPTIFSISFSWMGIFNIGSDNGLAPIRQPAVIWPNDDATNYTDHGWF